MAKTLSLEWQRNDPAFTWSWKVPLSYNRRNWQPKNISGWWNARRGLFCIKAQWLVPGSDIMRFGGGSCAATILFVITQPRLVNKWQPQFTGRWRPQHVDSALEPNLTLNLCTSSAQHPHYASWVTDLRLLVGSPRTWNNTKVIGGGGRMGNGWRQCDSFQKDFTERRGGKKQHLCWIHWIMCKKKTVECITIFVIILANEVFSDSDVLMLITWPHLRRSMTQTKHMEFFKITVASFFTERLMSTVTRFRKNSHISQQGMTKRQKSGQRVHSKCVDLVK